MTKTVAMKKMSYRPLAVILLLLSLCSRGAAEIRSFSGRIEASSMYIHYADGYVIAPGYVDVSGLTFSTLDDEGSMDDDDSAGGDDGNGNRTLDASSKGSFVDIVFFHEPNDCAYTRTGCDWIELGIGASAADGNPLWCCSGDAVELGHCEGDSQYGRLIINETAFTGQHRSILVPPTGDMKIAVKYGKFDVPKDDGNYVLIIANCQDFGRDVYAAGTYTWASKHGYLPGQLFGFMYFLAFLTLIYLVIFCWYGFSMKYYEDEIIPIQRWILVTILMGLVETFFRAGDFFVWNEDGTRFWFAMYLGVLVGVMKRAISRCLLVMVSLGWGVTCDTLGSAMKKIVGLGIIYAGLSAARDIMAIVADNDVQKLSVNEEIELIDVLGILTLVVFAINVIFIFWILDALNNTMEDLEATSQRMKLKIYLQLRSILLFAILFAVVRTVFDLVNTYMEESILEQQNGWIVLAMMELNFLMVLIGVSVLWKPNARAKEFAFVMELPSMGGNGDEDGELEAGAIPSALDDDDLALEEENGDGFKDEPESEGMQVKNGVHT